MNKKRLKTVFLVLLPVFAVGMAMSANSVMMYDDTQEKVTVSSYFALLPEGTFRVSTALAGILACLSGGLAITYLLSKKEGVVKAILYTALAGATMAVMPYLIQGDILVVPNVGVPILLIAQAAVAYFIPEKKETEGKKLKGKTL